MPARGFAGNHFGPTGPLSGGPERPADSSTKEGRKVNQNGPNTNGALLDFYFGEPTSSHKNSGGIHHSKW